jgi:ketosteroid isomerase-like protein
MSQCSFSAQRSTVPRHHWFFYVLLAFAGALLTFVGARAEQKVADDTTFRQLIDTYCAAWSSGNPDNAAKFYAKDDGLVFYDVDPFSYLGWKQYDADSKKFFDSGATITMTAGKELNVTRHGNIAWTTVPLHAVMKFKDGKTEQLSIRYTGIWEKHGKSWLIVHEHLSVPMAGN